jgi:hypothetical protein
MIGERRSEEAEHQIAEVRLCLRIASTDTKLAVDLQIQPCGILCKINQLPFGRALSQHPSRLPVDDVIPVFPFNCADTLLAVVILRDLADAVAVVVEPGNVADARGGLCSCVDG